MSRYFKAQTKGRRERKRKEKEEEGKESGRERGKGKLEVKLWQKRKKSQMPKLGIETGTPANAADALPLFFTLFLTEPRESAKTNDHGLVYF